MTMTAPTHDRLLRLINKQLTGDCKSTLFSASEAPCCLKDSSSTFCKYLHNTANELTASTRTLKSCGGKNGPKKQQDIVDAIIEISDLLCTHECPNAATIPIIEECVKQLKLILDPMNFTNWKTYGSWYFRVKNSLTKLSVAINLQRTSWRGLECDPGLLSSLNLAVDTFADISSAHYAKEQEYLSNLDQLKSNKSIFRLLDADIQRVFLNTVKGVEAAERQNTQILADLSDQFGETWADKDVFVEFTPFGSRISRLGGEESDIDISMSIFSINYDSGERNYVPIFIDNRQNGKPTQSVKQSRFVTSAILKKFRVSCGRSRSKFDCLEFIPKARIPIVKLRHIATRVEVINIFLFSFSFHLLINNIGTNTFLLSQYRDLG